MENPEMGCTTEIDIALPWGAIVVLAEHENAAPLNQHEGAWIQCVDDQWIVAVNAHERIVHAAPEGAMAIDMPPFHAAAWFNGWLAGTFSPSGGWFADGAAGNVQTFIAAVNRRIGQGTGDAPTA